jgi:hypothetical protein
MKLRDRPNQNKKEKKREEKRRYTPTAAAPRT